MQVEEREYLRARPSSMVTKFGNRMPRDGDESQTCCADVWELVHAKSIS